MRLVILDDIKGTTKTPKTLHYHSSTSWTFIPHHQMYVERICVMTSRCKKDFYKTRNISTEIHECQTLVKFWCLCSTAKKNPKNCTALTYKNQRSRDGSITYNERKVTKCDAEPGRVCSHVLGFKDWLFIRNQCWVVEISLSFIADKLKRDQ